MGNKSCRTFKSYGRSMGINEVILLYGIWNSVTKRFVYGIKEIDQETAWKKL